MVEQLNAFFERMKQALWMAKAVLKPWTPSSVERPGTSKLVLLVSHQSVSLSPGTLQLLLSWDVQGGDSIATQRL